MKRKPKLRNAVMIAQNKIKLRFYLKEKQY